MTDLKKLKQMIDEDNYPYFEDDYLQDKIDQIGTNDITLNSIAKDLCFIKSGIEGIKLGDIEIPSPRQYFLNLYAKFRSDSIASDPRGGQTRTVTRADGRK